MKTYKIKTIAIIFLSLLFSSLYSQSEYTKTIKKNYNLNENSQFKLTNKFGNVTVETNNSNVLDIAIKLTVKTKNKDKADDFFNNININFNKSGDLISAETDIEDNLHVKEFSIDYTVKMPEKLIIELSNKYGNIFINKLKSPSVIMCKYGNLRINELKTSEIKKPATINLKYSEGKISTCDYVNLTVKYSELFSDESRVLNINSGYSKLHLGKTYIIKAVSKYDPIYQIDEITKFELEGKYSEYTVGKLFKALTTKTKYSDIKIKNTDKDFSKIFIVNEYGNIKVMTDKDASYKLNAKAEYGNISSGVKTISTDSGTKVLSSGIVGKNEQTNSAITILSKYGNISVE